MLIPTFFNLNCIYIYRYQYLIKNLQDLELGNYKMNSLLEDKENTIKSLLRENEMLSEKYSTLQSDMKIVLNNRQKLDNLEEIITRFIQKEKHVDGNLMDENKIDANSTMGMTRSNTMNNFMSSQVLNSNKTNKMNKTNLFFNSGGDKFLNNNQNANNSIVIPERDMNRNNFQAVSSTIPRWYLNLKAKKI